jgi:arylsulfatase A-like enzyme
MKKSGFINLLSFGVICGFLIGMTQGFCFIIANQYVRYRMFRLVALSFAEEINRWVLLSGGLLSGIALILLLIPGLWKFLNKRKSFKKNDILFTLTALIFNERSFLKKWAFTLAVFAIFLNSGIFIDGIINAPPGPNVILISIDTLRADHLGCYGYDFDTSPYIDEFARESVLFKNAKSQIPWTLSSHISFLTSLYPSVFRKWTRLSSAIEDKYLMLAEIMRNYRYKTAAFTAGVWLTEEYGFKQGFDCFVDSVKPANIENIFNKSGIGWIKKQRGKFFVFLHCYEPHAPYNPPRTFKEKFACRYTPPFKLTEYYYHIADDFGELGENARKWFWESQDKQNILKTVIGLYDGEIGYVDSEINKLFSRLKQLGIFDNSLIIFLSDHGEGFIEHNSFGHRNLYEEILRVPLIIRLPKIMQRYNRQTINNLVKLIDVMPTILDICQIPYTDIPHQGVALSALIKRSGIFPNIYSFSERLQEKTISAVRYKYILSHGGRDGESGELYDLLNDPKESDNLLKDEMAEMGGKKRYLQLRLELFRQLNRNSDLVKIFGSKVTIRREGEFDEKMRDNFRSLGYLQ